MTMLLLVFVAFLSSIPQLQHIIIIMQENRSFDHYFGTFPGADGIPMKNGVPSVCVPVPDTNTCVQPYHDPDDRNRGGPHSVVAPGCRAGRSESLGLDTTGQPTTRQNHCYASLSPPVRGGRQRATEPGARGGGL